MADKNKNLSENNGEKVISMKLFATWEVEKSSPNCIPRICSLRLTRLVVLKPLENELTSVIIAMKMQSSKRVIRSCEIMVPSGGVTDVPLDLSFMLQYPHFLKRDGNKLQVMLQRIKRYKNRLMIGYKTLAVGLLSMSQVLQHSENREMCLYTDVKDHKNVVAKVTMLNISSTPVDNAEDVRNGRRKATSDVDRSPDVDVDTDDEEDDQYQETWSNDEMSDSENMMLEEGPAGQRSGGRSKVRPAINRQRNLKQKFVALLKRFKISEEVLDSEADHDLVDPNHPGDIDDLIEQLEDLSDSEPELDTMSVMSTPKPRLRPFFTGRGSSNDIDRHSLTEYPTRAMASDDSSNSQAERDTDPELSDAAMATSVEAPSLAESIKVELNLAKSPAQTLGVLQKPLQRERSTSYKERKDRKDYRHLERCNSMGVVENSPRKALLDQLSSVLGNNDDKLPDSLFLVNTAEWQGQLLVQKLQEKHLHVVCTCSDADVRATVNLIVSKIQKYCNCNSKSPCPVKVCISGGDGFINSVLRPYVEQFSAKSPDWQNHVKFLVIPLGNSAIGRAIAQMDLSYSNLFMDSLWRDTFDRTDSTKLESQEILNRVSKYITSANHLVHLPIAEAMVMCKGKGGEEESSQIFIPFLCELKLGPGTEVVQASLDIDDVIPSVTLLSSSPPQGSSTGDKLHTPPNSPNVGAVGHVLSQTPQTAGPSSAGVSLPSRDYIDLQVDYWTVTKPESTDKVDKSSKKESNKSSLKSAFKSLQVSHLLSTSHLTESQAPFLLTVLMREKKQKIRIGKKSKEESKCIEGISRLICTSKSQNHSLSVTVDGVDWSGVKFFQLSSQWQTHIKHFPVCVFSTDLAHNT